MKRRWNIWAWVGLGLAIAAVVSYITFFDRFPITRDRPWVSWLMFAAAGFMIYVGLRRAYVQPDLYRGKVSGPILAVLSLAICGFFLYGTLHFSRQLPASKGAPRVGERAPDFTLLDEEGNPVSLASLLTSPVPGGDQAKPRGLLLIFYRGYW